MRQPYELSIALRYLYTRGRESFISFISLVSVVGIAVAVAVLITVLAVVNGFEHELQRRVLGIVAHATIASIDAPLEDWRAVRARAVMRADVIDAAPYVEGQGLVLAGDKPLELDLRGIYPELEARVSSLGADMTDGSVDNLKAGEFGIVIGVELAKELGVGLGDSFPLYVAAAMITPLGILPRLRSVEVVGIFNSGVFEYDKGLAFLNFDDASKLFRTGGRATGLRLAVTDVFSAGRIAYDLAVELGGGYRIDDWARRYEPFFRSIQLSKAILTIILSLVICVASFNIVSTLIMVVREKRGDIAILRSIGTSPRAILGIFASQGTLIGLFGTLLGVLIGVGLALELDNLLALAESWFGTNLFSGEVYLISELPVQIRPGETALIGLLALALAVLATIYPAMSAARQPPAEALRYE